MGLARTCWRWRLVDGSLAAAGGAGTSTKEGAIFTFHQAFTGEPSVCCQVGATAPRSGLGNGRGHRPGDEPDPQREVQGPELREDLLRGGATRIAEHIIKDCACSTTALQELRGKLVAEKAEKDDRTKRKTAIAEDAGYKAPVEKWDSDSDSDKSDDEADLAV